MKYTNRSKVLGAAVCLKDLALKAVVVFAASARNLVSFYGFGPGMCSGTCQVG